MRNISLNEANESDEDIQSGFIKSKYTIFFLVILEISLYVKGYLCSSPIVKWNSVFFPFVKTYHQNMSEFTITVDNFTKLNRFLQIDIIFYRYTFNYKKVMRGQYNYSVEFLSNNKTIDFWPQKSSDFEYFSYQSYPNSLPVTIFSQPISNYDQLRSNLTIFMNLTELKGMSFDYFYVNSNFVQLYNNLSILFTVFSIFTFICFLIFCCSKTLKDTSTNDKFLLTLNILTILSVLNYQYFFEGIQMFKITIFMTDLLIVIFRVYSLFLLDSLISRSNSISEPVYTEMIRYFLFFFALLYHDKEDFEAKIYARSEEKPHYSIPLIKLIILFFHLWHIFICMFYFIRALRESKNKDSKKTVIKYGQYILFNLANTLVVRVILMFRHFHDNTALNLLVYRFSYVISTIIITNLRMHSKHVIDEYQKVNEDENDGENNIEENTLFPVDEPGPENEVEKENEDEIRN
ncbi:hypothetical protein M9Y10_015167 [Tritrichomonas musculus]|uniref:Intimal thickness related receptor IRP domain-containing protein n=1 Tax=Tritrichomonas musculus TaxID=1915356 RepID=A0ABR2L2B1_9EUKA